MSKPFYRLTRPYAGVQVKYEKKAYILNEDADEPVIVVKPGALLMELNDTPVLTPEKQQIKPTGKFYVTMETISPYHVVLDIPESNALAHARY